MRVDATSYDEATRLVDSWASAHQSRHISIAAVSTVMSAHDDPAVSTATNAADLVTPDGMPLVWGLRALGAPHASRVYGPYLMPRVLSLAEARGYPIGLYGSSLSTLALLRAHLALHYPRLSVVFSVAPPFRPLTPEEDALYIHRINLSGCRILFVGLSSPKQDLWMYHHRGRVQAVMLGVGAAFDFLAGTKPQAPRWMMRSGLEWLFRLLSEPRRLAGRYLTQNPRFLVLFLRQLLRHPRPHQEVHP